MERACSRPPPDESACKAALSAGFTLIEISIVLVIIGLVVGAVLVGQHLIQAARVRATITQIEKYNEAVNTFYGKYQALPGDIIGPTAAQFGFAARGPYAGEGDGNGIIEDNRYVSSTGNTAQFQGGGEITLFWIDLSTAGLIDGGFSTGSWVCCLPIDPVTSTTTPNLAVYFPEAKLGSGIYIYVWSGGIGAGGSGPAQNGLNYFGIEGISQYSHANGFATTNALSVYTAYSIDKKVDDGYPLSGRVTTTYITNTERWVGGTPGSAISGSATTCYDNGGNASAITAYSLSKNNGAGVNCNLSFQFQ